MILTALAAVSCVQKIQDGGPRSLLGPGDRLPSFEASFADGHRVLSDTLKGDVCLVFFDTSCGDCRRQLPVIQSVYDRYSPQVSFIAVSVAGEPGEWWDANGMTLPLVTDNGRGLYGLFAESHIPWTYLCRKGKISAVYSDEKFMTEKEFTSQFKNR